MGSYQFTKGNNQLVQEYISACSMVLLNKHNITPELSKPEHEKSSLILAMRKPIPGMQPVKINLYKGMISM